MSGILWKAFKLGNLFERSTKLALSTNQKDLNISKIKDDEHKIALISASRNGSGRVGYVENDLVKKSIISINKLTFDDQWGYTFFQKEDFVITGGHNAILEIIDEKLKKVLDNNLFAYSFLSLIINKITIKSKIFGYEYKINNKFDREIILLPCLEVNNDEEYIWEEDGNYYTLAVDYIKELMNVTKEVREQRTIRLYEAEKLKYKVEKSKFKDKYLKEKENVIWKAFKLESLFSWSSRKDLSLKNYNLIDEYEEGYVEVITGSLDKNNKFVLKSDLPNGYPIYSDCICINTNGSIGYSFYYKNEIVSPTSSVHILIHKNECLQAKMNEIINEFFASMITNIFTKSVFNRTCCLIDNDKFDREIILLPCLEINNDKEYIWEEDEHYYTLATDYISYIYLSGRVNEMKKLIGNYKYQY